MRDSTYLHSSRFNAQIPFRLSGDEARHEVGHRLEGVEARRCAREVLLNHTEVGERAAELVAHTTVLGQGVQHVAAHANTEAAHQVALTSRYLGG